MRNWSRVCDSVTKRTFHGTVWKALNRRRLSTGRIKQSASLDSSAGVSQGMFRHKPSTGLPGQGLFSFYSRQIVELDRSFSTSNTVWSFKQMSEQDKEKFKNYLSFGAVAVAFLFVSYMLKTMEYHQDYVYIEPSEDKK